MTADISVIDSPDRKAFRAETDTAWAWVNRDLSPYYRYHMDADGWIAVSADMVDRVRIEAEKAGLSVGMAE